MKNNVFVLLDFYSLFGDFHHGGGSDYSPTFVLWLFLFYFILFAVICLSRS